MFMLCLHRRVFTTNFAGTEYTKFTDHFNFTKTRQLYKLVSYNKYMLQSSGVTNFLHLVLNKFNVPNLMVIITSLSPISSVFYVYMNYKLPISCSVCC